MHLTIGIDVSKASFDVALLPPGRPALRKKFSNKLSGFSELNLLAQSLEPASVSVAMEATGPYRQGLAEFCFALGWTVYVINPARVKAYGVAVGQKNKTDRADALTIAQFALNAPGLAAWIAPSQARAELRLLARERIHAQDMLIAEQLRREMAPAGARAFIDERMALLQAQIKKLWARIRSLLHEDPELQRLSALLASIPGIGAWSAAYLLSELPPIDGQTKARQIASLFGLCPRNRESGASVRGKPRLAPQGRRRVIYAGHGGYEIQSIDPAVAGGSGRAWPIRQAIGLRSHASLDAPGRGRAQNSEAFCNGLERSALMTFSLPHAPSFFSCTACCVPKRTPYLRNLGFNCRRPSGFWPRSF